jgi:hypothetical protein
MSFMHERALQNWPVGQTFPHAPQFIASELRLTQTPLHIADPVAVGQMHTLA